MVLFIGNSRLASPLGVREIRKSARRSCGFEIRRQKRFDLFPCGFEIRLKRERSITNWEI